MEHLGNKQKWINIYINKEEFCNEPGEVKFTHIQLQLLILIELVISLVHSNYVNIQSPKENMPSHLAYRKKW